MSCEDQLARAYGLFDEVVQLASSDRKAYLDRVCSYEPGVRVAVERLLRADERACADFEFLESLPLNVTAVSPTSTLTDPTVGRRVGDYVISRRLSEGGFGSVYLALRSDDYQQRVAIKLIRRDLVSEPRILARFDLERQLLADLDHENISRLLDGGTAEDGRPYLVMEYIDGEPITKYCDGKQLTIEHRIIVFQKVCAAVAYAHRYGVVHRDIKPANILITTEGIPKLLDFGIAKLIAPRSRPVITNSEFGVPLTPQYASPEQVRGEGVSTQSDVYSLGAVLFELLTGRLPHALGSAPRTEIERMVCEQQPRRPSSVLGDPPQTLRADGTTDRTTPAEVTNNRGMEPRRLVRKLRGDLDNIVLMALRREPERRYASPTDLARDLQHYLEGKPVLARSESFAYVARKFIRRHLAGVAATALVCLTVLGALVLTTTTNVMLKHEKTVAATAAQVAESISEMAQVRFTTFPRQRSTGLDRITAIHRRISQLSDHDRNNALIKRLEIKLRSAAVFHMTLFEVDDRPAAEVRVCTVHSDWPKIRFFDRDLKHYVLSSFRTNADGMNLPLPAAIQSISNTQGKREIPWAAWEFGAVPGDSQTFSDDLRYCGTVYSRTTAGQDVYIPDDPKVARIYDLQNGMQPIVELKEPLGAIPISFAGDSVCILAQSTKDKIEAHVFSLPSGERITIPVRHRGSPYSVSLSPRGSRVAISWGEGKTVSIVDVKTGSRIDSTFGRPITRMCWHPDEVLIAAADNGRIIEIWAPDAPCPRSPSERRRNFYTQMSAHANKITSMSFSPCGNVLGSTGWGSQISFWDPFAGNRFFNVARDYYSRFQFSSDGKRIAYADRQNRSRNPDAPGDHTAFVYVRGFRDTPVFRVVTTSSCSPVACVEADAHGQIAAAAVADAVVLFDLATKQRVVKLDLPECRYVWPCVRDGTIDVLTVLADRIERRVVARGADGQRAVQGPFHVPPSIAETGFDEMIATRLNLRGEPFGFRRPLVPENERPINAAAATGQWVAMAKRVAGPRPLEAIRVMQRGSKDVQKCRELTRVSAPARLMYSPNGEFLAVVTPEDYRLWRVGSWEDIATIPHGCGSSACLSFCSASKHDVMLAATLTDLQGDTGNSSVAIYDLQHGFDELVRLRSRQSAQINSLCFTAQGAVLLAGTGTGNVQIWKVDAIYNELAKYDMQWPSEVFGH